MREQADAVQRMQDCIESHLEEPLTLQQLAKAAGYSPWHAARLFREMVGITPLEYLRARRLSRAALRLRDSGDRVLDVALEHAFDSHEGFTRAFSGRFGVTPDRYRRDAPPIPLFMPRSARDAYLMKNNGGAETMETTNTVFVHVVDRPARRLIVQRAKKAAGYWEYCEEMGCDAEGILTSLKGASSEIMGLWMPAHLRPAGTSEYVMGIEVPAGYTGPVPGGMELIDLPACQYLHFQGEPYKDEEMGQACAALDKAFENYRPDRIGWQWADELGPTVQYAPMPERGCALARPVKKL
jgi:AraC-like DNA-binding protein